MQDVALVILDYHMPELDGVEAAKRIRELETSRKCKPIPIIGLTGDDSEATTIACQQAGMNGILAKPIRKQDLKNILTSLLHSFDKQQ
jgi:CheY-like chemotaxis protein